MTNARTHAGLAAVGVGLWLAAAAGGPHALAQPPATPAPDPATTTATPALAAAPAMSESVLTFMRQQAADAIARVALVDLRVNPLARDRDYQVAALLLGEACKLRPGDQSLTRLALDAATQAGESEQAIALTRELVRLDPTDTRAQLSLISARVAGQQTIEGRLAAMERFLGAEGASLDPAVRSRLALDAALLYREQGRVDRFADKIAQATALDATNKDAAALAYSFFTQRVDDRGGAFELLASLLKADPLDSTTHETIARLLADAGAYRQARRFFGTTAKLLSGSGRSVRATLRTDQLLCDWMVDGAERVVKNLTVQVMTPRQELEGLIAEARQRGAPTDQYPDPKSYRLIPDSEQVRLLASHSIDRTEAAAESMEELLASLQQYRDWASGAIRRPDTVSAEEAAGEARLWASETLWLRLWTGLKLENIEADLAAIQADPAAALSPDVKRRLDAMVLWRTGRVDEAQTALTALAETDPIAEMALGLMAEGRGDKTAAVERYTLVARRLAGTLAGVWSAQRVAHLTGTPLPPGPEAVRLGAMADGIPAIFDQMVSSPSSFMAMFVDAVDREIPYTGRAMVRVRLLNRAPFALAVGAERPLNTRMLLSSEVSVGGVRAFSEAIPEVVNIDRRLRLLPREEINAVVWADPGFAGWALNNRTVEHVVRRFRVLQGFTLDERGVPRAGPGCLSAEASMPQTRLGLPRRADDEWIALIGSARGEAFIEALYAARARLNTVGKDPAQLRNVPMDGTAASRLADAILARYRAEDPLHRMLILACVPTGLQISALANLDRGLRETPDTDATVLLLKLVTRATDDSDPGFTAAAALPDRAFARAAAHVAARLKEEGVRGYAELTGTETPGTGPLDP